MRIEEFVKDSWCGIGRPPHERAWLANAFVAKAVLNLPTTAALIDRLRVDRSLERIRGFSGCKKLPSEATFCAAMPHPAAREQPAAVLRPSAFSRAFKEFARNSRREPFA